MGFLGAKCRTQIREDLFLWITRSRESKTHGSTSTYYPQVFPSDGSSRILTSIPMSTHGKKEYISYNFCRELAG